jgi:hypothetical protein
MPTVRIISEEGVVSEVEQHVWDMMPEHKYRFTLAQETPKSVQEALERLDPAQEALERLKASKK